MDDIIPFFIGFTGKIIDEVDDQKLNFDPLFKETLKSLNVCLFTLTSKNDFLFAFSTLILSLFGAGIDTYYWKSFIAISILLSIIYYTSVDNWPLFILVLSLIILSTRIEENSFPEEYSVKKLLSRIFGLLCIGLFYFVPTILKKYDISLNTTDVNYIRKLILIALGGLLASIVFQLYFLAAKF
jgi:hypothetical protein